MKNIFKINSIAFTINNQPFEIKGIELETEASAQELSVSGGNINKLVEIIGDIADRFDKNSPKEIEVKEIKVEEPVKVSETKKEDFCELPTSKWSGGEKNITKAWKEIPVPEELKPVGKTKYRWLDDGALIGDSVTVDGGTYGVVYVHLEAMNKKSFIIVRSNKVKFEDDIPAEDFDEFLETIEIPNAVKDYIRMVVEL